MDAFRIFIVEDDPWYADLIRHTLALNPDSGLEKFASGRGAPEAAATPFL